MRFVKNFTPLLAKILHCHRQWRISPLRLLFFFWPANFNSSSPQSVLFLPLTTRMAGKAARLFMNLQIAKKKFIIFYMSLFHTYCRGTFFTLFDKDIEPNYFWKIWASEASWVCFCCFCIDIPRQSPSPPPPPPSCWCPCALQAMSCTPPPILSPPSCWRPGASWTTRRCSPRSRCSTSRCTQASTPLEGERRIDEELIWSKYAHFGWKFKFWRLGKF